MINHVRIPVPAGRRLVLATIALAAVAAACHSKPAAPPVSANAWAVVNAHEITRDDVEKAYRRTDQSDQPVGEDEAFTAKLALLDDLIAQELFLAKARDLKIDVPEAELETAFAEARKNMSEEAFQQELARRHLTAADMRDGLRRELLVQKLFTREVSSKVSVTDQEISAFYEANKSQFNRPEDAYRVAQIVVTPVRENQIANRTGSDATTALESVKKIQMIMERLKGAPSSAKWRPTSPRIRRPLRAAATWVSSRCRSFKSIRHDCGTRSSTPSRGRPRRSAMATGSPSCSFSARTPQARRTSARRE